MPLTASSHSSACPPLCASQTGGHGLLGSNLVEALLARGEKNIRILDLSDSPLFQPEREAGLVTFFHVRPWAAAMGRKAVLQQSTRLTRGTA